MRKSFIIGITGGSGAGKTSFIHQLKENYSREEVCFISQDDYYKARKDQHTDKNGYKNFDLPKSIDKKAFARDLNALLSGKTITRLEYVFNNELANPKPLVFNPAPIIIVEGIFIMHLKKIRKMLNLKIFIHAKENLKVIRRIKRDRVERNYPLDDVLYRYEKHVLPTFEKYIKPYIDKCDIVINNNDNFKMGLDVINLFLKQKLMELKDW